MIAIIKNIFGKRKNPTVLIILDGWGIAPPSPGNAISLAKTPFVDELFKKYPFTLLGATGEDVGLDDHQMSGSEAGHMNIGAGRIVAQDSHFISESIKNGSFFSNPILIGAIRHAKISGGNFHIMGLMSDIDSPHSNPEHFRALLRLAKNNEVNEVYCHLFTDGRDSYPKSALEQLENFKKIIAQEGIGKIATISGRFYAMDRAKNWKRLTRAYDAIVFSQGEKAGSPEEAIESAYAKNLTDEYVIPTVIFENGKPIASLGKNDSIVFYNLRSDRARQFSKLFVATNKEGILNDDMPIIDHLENLYFTAMTDFGPDLDVHTAFPGRTLEMTLPMALGGKKQLYIAESEKYAHITYFLNGGYPDPVDGEEWIVVPSPIVDSYVKCPEMSADKIADKVIEGISKNKYDFIAINFANADMVAHTGNIKATIKAVEFVDKQVARIAEKVFEKNGNIIVTADHGNADEMIDRIDGEKRAHTFHTKNPVPFVIAGEKFFGMKLKKGGVLGNIAPTILDAMGVKKPKEIEKESLIER
ncbi:MAG: 2,3-bisphosphoglycerate-independent phosphoglycerate mutase [Parcubacteria group bacterium Athens0714_25]|nr:MAG: 2,3-bisphosphoglycerate-independent phosphoglycerate mutase [Parcubacteria group bacterium Athens0714_25]